jgi:DNA-binding transcriptional regulator YiaG
MGEELLDRFRAEHHAPPMNKLPTMTPEELRAARKEMGLTQADAAMKYAVALRTYKNWELGEASIPGPAIVLTKYLLEEFRRPRK